MFLHQTLHFLYHANSYGKISSISSPLFERQIRI